MRIATTTVILLGLMVPASSHSWYDGNCCSDQDCEPTTKVIELRSGFFVVETREWFGPRDPKVRLSKDQDFHRCRMTGDDGMQKTRCLYVPQPSF